MPQSPHDQSADAVHEGRPVEAQYTKQGRGGRRISIVLILGLILTALGFAVAFLLWSGPFKAADARLEDGRVPVEYESRRDVPTADAPTTSTGGPVKTQTGEAPNVNAPTVRSTQSGSAPGE